jgi:hypothetical protein
MPTCYSRVNVIAIRCRVARSDRSPAKCAIDAQDYAKNVQDPANLCANTSCIVRLRCGKVDIKLMARIRTRISVTGFNDAEIAEGMPYFRQYLHERPWLIKPKAEWNTQEDRLVVTIETDGDDPKVETEGVFDEVWDCVIAAFTFSSERIVLKLLDTQPVV